MVNKRLKYNKARNFILISGWFVNFLSQKWSFLREFYKSLSSHLFDIAVSSGEQHCKKHLSLLSM